MHMHMNTCPFAVIVRYWVQCTMHAQSVPVNIGDLLKQIRQACGNLPPQIVIGGSQAVLANSGDKSTASGSTTATNSASIIIPCPNKSTSDPVYLYKVKIINLNKKSDVAVFYLNDFSTTFESVTSLRVKLIETFKERVPNTLDFNVGYYEGSQQAKIWLVTADDLKIFYQKVSQGWSSHSMVR